MTEQEREERLAFPITNEEFVEKLRLLTQIDNPAFMVMNNVHTLMVSSEGPIKVLAFSSSMEQPVFTPCSINILKRELTFLDKSDKVRAIDIPEYLESKKKDRKLGLRLSRIS